jgi:hypothetical protein
VEFPKTSWGSLRAPEMALESTSLESASAYLGEVEGKLDISSSPDGTILRVSCLPIADLNRAALMLLALLRILLGGEAARNNRSSKLPSSVMQCPTKFASCST